MNNTARPFLVCILIATLIALLLFFLGEPAQAETVYVSIREGTYLNGREYPSTKACITMRLFNGDKLNAVAFNGEWIEVEGGESGTSFVKAQYLSEIQSPIIYRNVSGGRVRVRKTPNSSRTIAWISANDTIKVDKQLLGWGYTHDGWVDLQYFQKEG